MVKSSAILILGFVLVLATPLGSAAKRFSGFWHMKTVEMPLQACGKQNGLSDWCRGERADIDGDRDKDLLVVHHWCGASMCFTKLVLHLNDSGRYVEQGFSGREFDFRGELRNGGWLGGWYITKKRQNGVSDICWIYDSGLKTCFRRDTATQTWRPLEQRVPAPPPRRPAPASSSGTCDYGRFVGNWSVTSRVYKAVKRKASGVNGYYYVQISGSGCRLSAAITKVGFSAGGGIREFPPHKRQHGVGTLTIDPTSQAATVSANLARPDGSYVQGTTFTLQAGGGFMDGVWHYTGAMWNQARMRGSLRGQRDASQYLAHTRLQDVSCGLQCDLRCEVVKPSGATMPVSNWPGWGSCQRRCRRNPKATVWECR